MDRPLSGGRGTAERAVAGLCAACRHARRVRSARGSSFWLCRLAERDAAYPRYPRLPVLACRGFEGDPDPSAGPGPVRHEEEPTP